METLKKINFSGTQLKIIAVMCMLLDHVGDVLFPKVTILRIIGRISFPIFAYLIAEGMVHTSNWKKYMLRLLIFAIISEIPFDLMTSGKIIDWSNQNVLFTLFLGGATIALFKTQQTIGYIGAGIIILLGNTFGVDYGLAGILLVLVIYILNRDDVRWGACGIAVWCLCFGGMEYWGMLSCLFILRYNKERGYNTPVLKYGFYAFYPIHMLVLYLVSILV